MVIAVRCPEEKCRKYQLVEDADRGKVVACLICKAAIRVPGTDPTGLPKATPLPPAPSTAPANLPRARPL